MPGTVDRRVTERMVAVRRELHHHPELSWQEHHAADQVCRYLDDIGVTYRRGVAGTGVIADLPGAADKPLVAIRADMDALPILEETGLSFASEMPGVMHACGHDGHTSMALGALELLSSDPDRVGPVRCLFQPAEELGAGALAMIEAGALDGVDMIFGVHVDRHHTTGTIVVHEGVVNASTDSFRIEISGQGGHAARPHESVDAVVVGSLLVTAIQTIVSREINPVHPSVVTVGRFDAGSAANVIAGHAILEGTVRSQDPEVRDHLVEAMRRVATAVGQLHEAEVTVSFDAGTPVVVNSPAMASLARRAAGRVVPEENVVPLHAANMGGEDFAYYLERVPGCFVRLGAQVEGREGYPAHSSRFDFNEAVLPVGARYFQEVVKEAHATGA
jgi:hippurate hydrolase